MVVVVGLPLSLDGSRGPAAVSAAEEAEALRAVLEEHGVGVELFDERLTTVTAHQALAAGGAREPRSSGRGGQGRGHGDAGGLAGAAPGRAPS